MVSFFKNLFSKKGNEKPQELSLEEIPGFIEKRVAGQRAALEKTVALRFAEIKHLFNALEKALSALESSSVETENPKLAKVVATTKAQASRQLSSLPQKLALPDLNDLEAVRRYSAESEALLHNELQSFGKNIAYTSIVLKEQIKNIGSVVQELAKNFSSLNQEFEKNRLVFLEPFVLREASLIIEVQKKALETGGEIALLETEIASVQAKLAEAEAESKALLGSEEAKMFFSLEEKKQAFFSQKKALEQSIFEKVFSVEKPLKKLSRLVENNGFSLPKEAKYFLNDFLANPVSALKQDPKADYFKLLLNALEKAFESGKIEEKEKELEKTRLLIKELIAFDFFSNFFWKSNSREIEIQKLEKEIRQSDFLQKKDSAEKKVLQQTAFLQEKKSQLDSLKKELEKENFEITSLHASLEKNVSGFSPGTKIKL